MADLRRPEARTAEPAGGDTRAAPDQQQRALLAGGFLLVGLIAFPLLFENFIQFSPTGERVNQAGLLILEITYGLTLAGGALSLIKWGVGRVATFFVALLFVLLLYGRRVASQYLFQDDFHHVLPTAHLGFVGLWTPFVDHVTPLWRLWHWIPIQVLGAYLASYAFPVLGAVNLGLLSATLFHSLKRRAVSAPLFWSLLVVAYPGFQRVMYWTSTNAMVLSSILGILALDWYERSVSEKDDRWQARGRILGLLVGSFYLWSTGLAFSLFLLTVPLIERLIERLRSRTTPVPWKETLRARWLAVPAAALAVFGLTRVIVFATISDEFLRRNLWLLNAREHGHTPMLLRPLLWPFASYWQGAFVYGLFGGDGIFRARAAMGEALYFAASVLVGFGLFLVALYLGLRSGGRARNLYRAVLFPLSLYAIIFAGRGQTLIGFDFISYGLDNDWYRITAVSGMIWFLALSCPPLTVSRHALVGLSVLVLGAMSLHRSRSPHAIETFAKPTIATYQQMSCLSKLDWPAADYAFASKYVYLPLAGSNPGNYWTGYQPSYFDLFFSSSPASLIPIAPFDPEKAERLSAQLSSACGELAWRADHAWFATGFPAAENQFFPLPVSQTGSGPATVSLAGAGRCEFGENQLLRLTWTSTAGHQGPLGLLVDERRFGLSNQQGYPSDFTFASGDGLTTFFELRALTPEQRCREHLEFSASAPGFELETAALLRGPMFEDGAAKRPPARLVAPPRAPRCGRLNPGQQLKVGQATRSCDGRFKLVLQGDGNLVLYQDFAVLWNTHTTGLGGVRAVMQEDGNFVLYSSDWRPLFNTGTTAMNSHLAIQTDGNLVVYDGDTPRWNSGTGGH